jgi:hypothetical protein
MRHAINSIKLVKNLLNTSLISASAFAAAYSQCALAQENFKVGGEIKKANNFNDVSANINSGLSTFKSLAIGFAAVAGTVLIATSLFNLYKASKDPSHQVKPMAGVVGLVIGGLLVAVSAVVGISSNSVVGAE